MTKMHKKMNLPWRRQQEQDAGTALEILLRNIDELNARFPDDRFEAGKQSANHEMCPWITELRQKEEGKTG